MKLPQGFKPNKPSDVKDLLEEPKLKNLDVIVELSDRKRIRYWDGGSDWIIDYTELEKGDKWVLSEREYSGVKWYDCYCLNERAKRFVKEMLQPAIDFLNLKEEEYSIEKDNIRTILDRYATKISENDKNVTDRKTDPFRITFYEKEEILIELKEYLE